MWLRLQTEHTAAILQPSPWQPVEIMAPFGNKRDLRSLRNQRRWRFAVEVVFSDCFRPSLWTENEWARKFWENKWIYSNSCDNIKPWRKARQLRSKCPGPATLRTVPWLLEAWPLSVPWLLETWSLSLSQRMTLDNPCVAVRDFGHFLIGGRNTSWATGKRTHKYAMPHRKHTESTQCTVLQIQIKLKWVPRLLTRAVLVFQNIKCRILQPAALLEGWSAAVGVSLSLLQGLMLC